MLSKSIKMYAIYHQDALLEKKRPKIVCFENCRRYLSQWSSDYVKGRRSTETDS